MQMHWEYVGMRYVEKGLEEDSDSVIQRIILSGMV